MRWTDPRGAGPKQIQLRLHAIRLLQWHTRNPHYMMSGLGWPILS